jgi:hypothetical protein
MQVLLKVELSSFNEIKIIGYELGRYSRPVLNDARFDGSKSISGKE